MDKEQIVNEIDIAFKERTPLIKKGKYWYQDDGVSKLLFYVEPARYMDGVYINVGIYYNNLDDTKSKAIPNFHNWHLNANIGYIYQNIPIVIPFNCSDLELKTFFDIIINQVIPYVNKWRDKGFLKTYPNIWDSPWQKKISKDRLNEYIATL